MNFLRNTDYQTNSIRIRNKTVVYLRNSFINNLYLCLKCFFREFLKYFKEALIPIS